MTKIDELKTELLAGHPDTGTYNADSTIAAAELNAVNRTTNVAIMTGSEIMNNIVPSAFTGLSAEDKQTVWDILHLGNINPFGVEATLLIGVFGSGSATITALAAARKNDVSRAVELGLGEIKPGHIERARYVEPDPVPEEGE